MDKNSEEYKDKMEKGHLLMEAIQVQNIDAVRKLIDGGADVRDPN